MMKIKALALSAGLGIVLFAAGALSNHPGTAQGEAGAPLIAAGLILFLIPVLIAAGWVLCGLFRAARAEHRRYRAWKSRLTPAERNLVSLGEAAAFLAAGEALHHSMSAHRHEIQGRLTRSQVHGFGS